MLFVTLGGPAMSCCGLRSLLVEAILFAPLAVLVLRRRMIARRGSGHRLGG